MKALSKIKIQLKRLITEGWTPQKLSLGIVAGVLLGIFPVLASTSVLCYFAARIFGLNHILVQSVNQLAYPLQLMLLLPFIQAGKFILGQESGTLSISSLTDTSQWSEPSFYTGVILQQLYGVFFWTLICLPLAYLIYRLTLKKLTLQAGNK